MSKNKRAGTKGNRCPFHPWPYGLWLAATSPGDVVINSGALLWPSNGPISLGAPSARACLPLVVNRALYILIGRASANRGRMAEACEAQSSGFAEVSYLVE